MTKPVRLQLSRRKGFNLQAFSRALNGREAVHAGRPGPLGNPFIVGKHGTAADCVDLHKAMLAGLLRVGADPDIEALERARRYVADSLPELAGRNIACWCRLCPTHKATGKPLGVTCTDCPPCHVDVLLELANRGAKP